MKQFGRHSILESPSSSLYGRGLLSETDLLSEFWLLRTLSLNRLVWILVQIYDCVFSLLISFCVVLARLIFFLSLFVRLLTLERWFWLNPYFWNINHCLLLFADFLIEGVPLRPRLNVDKLKLDVNFNVKTHLNAIFLFSFSSIKRNLLLKVVLQVTLKLGDKVISCDKPLGRFDAHCANVVHPSQLDLLTLKISQIYSKIFPNQRACSRNQQPSQLFWLTQWSKIRWTFLFC